MAKKTSRTSSRSTASSGRAASSKKKTTTKKKAPAKKAPAKKTATKKTTTKKSTTKKAPAKKAASKKTTTKKSTARKAPAKKVASKKTTTKKSTTKKAPAKKAPAKKVATKKTTTKKTPAKSTKKTTPAKTAAKSASATSKKTTTKKSTTKKTPAKKASGAAAKTTSKKAATKKTPAKKAPAKKATTKKRSGRKSLGARSVAEAASMQEADKDGYVIINGRRVRMISTGGVVPTKKKTVASATEESDRPKDLEKPVKTTLTAKQLREYRTVLTKKRAEIVGDLRSMEEAANDERTGDKSKLPLHMADVGSDVYSQDLNIGLAENELVRLREIDDALARISAKTYGMCLLTGDPIPAARLAAKPWAKYTIESARRIERGWVG